MAAHTMLATKRLNAGKGGSTFKGVSSSSSSSSQPRPRPLSRFSCRASSGNEQTRGSSNGVETGSAGLYFVDKLVEDPVNALLVLGPRALAGALEAMPKTVEEVQVESQQVRDRLTMLAQDPRPWEVKSQMLVQEADKQLEELVEKGTKTFGDYDMAGGIGGSSSSSSSSTSAASTSSNAMSEEEELSFSELSMKVAEFTNLYLLLGEVKKARANYESAAESEEKMLLGIWNDTKASLAHRMEELTEGLEDDMDLPFKDLIDEAKTFL
jgi:hypothetical protein